MFLTQRRRDAEKNKSESREGAKRIVGAPSGATAPPSFGRGSKRVSASGGCANPGCSWSPDVEFPGLSHYFPRPSNFPFACEGGGPIATKAAPTIWMGLEGSFAADPLIAGNTPTAFIPAYAFAPHKARSAGPHSEAIGRTTSQRRPAGRAASPQVPSPQPLDPLPESVFA